ncbi:MAG: beta-lactamase family protein [Clostridia bacterium]|nr:beta-lactamase family protein [Clostridia bacterium]
MTNFEKLIELIANNTKGGYACAEMTDDGYVEHRFRRGHGGHNVYSIGKCVTGCAVGILEAEGKLRDTDTVFSHISELFPKDYDPKWEAVTLRDVMFHRTGVPQEANIDIDSEKEDFWEQGRDDFLAYFLGQPIVYEPGNGPFIYCDTNYYLIGRIVEKITGKPCGIFLQERMFNHLQWRGNAWGTCPQGHTLCGTGLFVTPLDLCRFGLMLSHGGEYNGKRILTPEWIEKARGEKGKLGYGFTNSADGRWFFAGGMLGQEVYIFPERHTSLVVMGHFMPNDEIKKEIVPLYLD